MSLPSKPQGVVSLNFASVIFCHL